MTSDIILPKLGLTMEEAKIVSWLKELGDEIEEDDVIMEVETDKATLEVESPGKGFLVAKKVSIGDSVSVGEVIGVLSDENVLIEDTTEEINSTITPETPKQKEGETKPVTNESTENVSQMNHFKDGRIRVSPAARRLAREKRINIEEITGSGPRGRVTLADVKEFKQTDAIPFQEVKQIDSDKKVSLSTMRKVIANRLQKSYQEVPHFMLTRSIDCTNVEKVRKTLNAYNQSDVKLSLNDFIVKALAMALNAYPDVNAYFMDGAEPYILEKSNVGIGLAVAVDNGLVVPVIKQADKLSLQEIAKIRRELVDCAQKGKLTPDDMSEGTFTISNLGGFEIEEFTAIINPPESGILAVGKTILTPVVTENREIEIKPLLKVTASFDHRLIDGAQGARFLNDFIEKMQAETWNLF